MKDILTGFAIALVLSSAGCAASNASAEAGRTSKLQTLQSLLAAEEHVASAEELNRIGPEVPDLLIGLAQDRNQDIAHRARATSYLGYYEGNPKVEAFLSGLVKAPESETPLLRRGLRALAHVSKGKAVPTISPHLKSTDTLVREAAAQALADTEDAGALRTLQEAAAQEREPFLKKRMQEMADTAGDQGRKLKPAPDAAGSSEVQSTHY